MFTDLKGAFKNTFGCLSSPAPNIFNEVTYLTIGSLYSYSKSIPINSKRQLFMSFLRQNHWFAFNHCVLKVCLHVTYLALQHYYRPQRSWGKVMFLHVSVILSTISGGHRNTYGWQAGSTHPTGMFSCFVMPMLNTNDVKTDTGQKSLHHVYTCNLDKNEKHRQIRCTARLETFRMVWPQIKLFR